jgi:hypothetical protein
VARAALPAGVVLLPIQILLMLKQSREAAQE